MPAMAGSEKRGVAQLAERTIRVREAAGSNPATPTKECTSFFVFSSLKLSAPLLSGKSKFLSP